MMRPATLPGRSWHRMPAGHVQRQGVLGQCCTAGHGAVERADRLKLGLSGGSRARTGVRPAPLRQPRRQRLEEHVIHAARGGG